MTSKHTKGNSMCLSYDVINHYENANQTYAHIHIWVLVDYVMFFYFKATKGILVFEGQWHTVIYNQRQTLSCLVWGLFEMGILLSSSGYPSWATPPRLGSQKSHGFVHGGRDKEITEYPSLLSLTLYLDVLSVCTDTHLHHTPVVVSHSGDMFNVFVPSEWTLHHFAVVVVIWGFIVFGFF